VKNYLFDMTTACLQNVISANWQSIKNAPKTPKKVDWRIFNPNKDLHPAAASLFFHCFELVHDCKC